MGRIARIKATVECDWPRNPFLRGRIIASVWRFNRAARRRYMHMRPGRRCGERTCLRCAWLTVSGGHRRAKRLWLNKHLAMRATSSWWPREPRTLDSGLTYRVSVRPYSYEEYQAWMAQQ